MIDLPITFPNEADVIAEEAARFRALSPDEQVRTLGQMHRLYWFLIENSDNPEAAARAAMEEEERGRRAIEEFAAHNA